MLAVPIAQPGVRRRPRRVPRQQQPDRQRESYFAALKPLVDGTFSAIDAELIPQLDALLAEAGTRLDAWRFDNWTDVLDRILARVAHRVATSWPIARLEDIARRLAGQTSEFQKAQLRQQIRSAISVDPFIADPRLSRATEAFTSENVRLISSLPQQALFGDHSDPKRDVPGVRDIVLREVRAGARAESIARQIRERHGVTERRAKLIARDQVGKFYGEMNRHRQTEMGVDGYVWRTAGDNSVRECHAALEGQRCSWSDPPMGGGTDEDEAGHPGSGINCRCMPEPDLQSYWASL